MSYRDELGQAHAKIERLEEELRDERAKKLDPPPPKRTGLVVLLGLVVALAGGGVLGYRAYRASQAPMANVSVAEAVRNPERYIGRKMRVQGDLVEKSTLREADPSDAKECLRMSFVLEREGLRLPVRLDDCMVPHTYRDAKNVLIVAEGTLEDGGRGFHASMILVHWDPMRGATEP